MTDDSWKPGDPIYPRPVPWTLGDPAQPAGHRDNGRCWCDGPPDVRPPHWTARYDRGHPVPRFYPVPTLAELHARLPLLVEPEETA